MAAAQALSFTPSGTVLYIALELGEGKWVTDQRFSGPIGTDQIEHAAFNQAPLGSAWRKMSRRNRQAELNRLSWQDRLPNNSFLLVSTLTTGQPCG